MTHVLGISRSVLGQPWRWRAPASNGGEAIGDWAGDDLTTRILLARGAPREALDSHRAPSIRGFMPDPSTFRDMDKAALRLAAAVERGEQIAIFGDYDVDGATSTALLLLVLRDLGVEARPYIPDRIAEGYGPNAAALHRLVAEGAGLIVTVDCGAQAFEPLAAAHAAGIDVVVVDHHQCAAQLPHAHALVNPNRLDESDGRAHGHLAAVGVCFLLAAALFCANLATTAGWALAASLAPPPLVATVEAMANIGGSVGGSLAPLLTGVLAEATGSFTPALWLAATLAVLCAGAAWKLATKAVAVDHGAALSGQA